MSAVYVDMAYGDALEALTFLEAWDRVITADDVGKTIGELVDGATDDKFYDLVAVEVEKSRPKKQTKT